MAKPKQRDAKRIHKATKSAAKPAHAKSAKKPAVKQARKVAARTASKVAKPAPKKAAPAKSTKSAAGRAVKTSRASAKPAAAKKGTHAPTHVDKPAPHAAPAHRADHGPAHAPARKPAHARPVGGVAARLSVAAADEQTITREDGRYALPATVNIELPKGYHPSEKEEYMSPRQLAYFRQKLKDWRDQLVEESRQTMENLREEVRDVGDDAERATRETENSLELRTRDRYRKLISKIEKALRKIEEGRYGYCEETDEEIGLERLEARPIATLSLDAQERREHLQKQMGD
ncbi:MAG TPA: RNA polymerase-binding protein DksA [Rhodanobacteraceae bacterium]|nr:RNA polymerase-binding protein DksA [Rhodanobacteraceae bacterium]